MNQKVILTDISNNLSGSEDSSKNAAMLSCQAVVKHAFNPRTQDNRDTCISVSLRPP